MEHSSSCNVHVFKYNAATYCSSYSHLPVNGYTYLNLEYLVIT